MSLKKLGRYELIRVLGKGAMGVVYEGRDPNLDRRVAIKTVRVENLSEEAAVEYEARFRTEARSAARLQHPNIVSVYDSDRDGNVAFLVMEYIQGDDLKHHLDRGVRYTLEQSMRIIRDLLAALDYAHKQGIVHRDIKPANLLIEPGGRVKLTDFGVARIQDSGEATRTQGSMVGTLKYMSPEQVQGQKIDSRSDLFSAGVVLYQLLTDRRPFDGDNDFSIIHQIIGHNPDPPSQCNPRLPSSIDAVVARALAKDREQRFQTARDFAVALQGAVRRAEDSTVTPPANPFRRPADGPGSGSRGGAGSTVPMSTTTPSASSITQELELVYWKDVKDSSDPEEIETFLAKFPSGIYADLAARRLRKLLIGRQSPDSTMLSGLASEPGAAVPPLPAAGAPDPDLDETRLPSEKAGGGNAVSGLATASDQPRPASPGFAPPGGFRSTSSADSHEDDVTQPLHPAPAALVDESPRPEADAVSPLGASTARAQRLAQGLPIADAGAAQVAIQSATRVRPSAWVLVIPVVLVAAGLVAWLWASTGPRSVLPAATGSESAGTATLSATTPTQTPSAVPTAADTTQQAGTAAVPVTAPSGTSISTISVTALSSTVTIPATTSTRTTVVRSTGTRTVTVVQPAPAPLPAGGPPETRPPAPADPPPVAYPRPTPAPTPGPVAVPPAAPMVGPDAACEGRFFIALELCLREQCDRAANRNHPTCVRRREIEQWRRENERLMQQGTQ